MPTRPGEGGATSLIVGVRVGVSEDYCEMCIDVGNLWCVGVVICM